MRIRRFVFFYLSFCFFLTVEAQNSKGIVSGPMLGQVEMRTAKIWVEAGNDAKSVAIRYWKSGDPAHPFTRAYKGALNNDFNPVTIDLVGLEMNTKYDYQVVYNGVSTKFQGTFTTKDLWQWRKPVPDFSFLTGSCAYFNEPRFDRPGKPYGGDSTIFLSMAKEPSAFMVWLGDNWYTREADYLSEWGLWYRASRDRSVPELQPFLKAMPHYAIWDDHDYGSNDADKTYPLKSTSREVFKGYWANPSYGDNGEGIYSKVSYGDADFFLMDDRTYRSADAMQPLIDGKPNPSKRMWGPKQMDWLKNALINSQATFKFIVTGSQTLNPASPVDCLQHYPIEFNEFINFLMEEKIEGVVLLTGDRHHSEVIRYDRVNGYPLYDITSSPLTSGVAKVGEAERGNPARVAGTLIEAQNYTKIQISGAPKSRELTVQFLGVKAEKLGEWHLKETELKFPSGR
jgi:alkaline phosphatase D